MDVIDRAYAIVDEIASGIAENGTSLTDCDTALLSMVIAQALAAENEACAAIVEETPFAEGTHTGERQLDLKRRAAAAIRARVAIAKAEGKP